MPSDIADWFTDTVEARTEMGEALRAKGAEWLKTKRLKLADVEELVRQGVAAKLADQDQKVQLADQAVGRSGRSVDAKDVAEREAELAAVLAAAIGDLFKAGKVDDALFLAKLSFARYRTRVVAVPVDPNAPPIEEAKKVERVQKTDNATRADGLAALCVVLRGRPAILAELTERGLDDAELTRLEEDAEAVAAHGRNTVRRVEATAREAEAVLAQRTKWSEVRRLVKRAVKGDPVLEEIYSRC